MKVLGIESSCDESGVALAQIEGQGVPRILAQALHSQIAMHQAYGGVVPELASRDHVRRLTPLLREVMAEAGLALPSVDVIAYTRASQATLQKFDFGGTAFGPSAYVVSQLTGAYQSVPDFLDTKHTIETAQDADAYLSRLAAFGDQVEADTDRLRHDTALGVVPPDFILDLTIEQLTKTRLPAAQALVVTSLARRAAEKGLSDRYGRDAAKIYGERVLPALDDAKAMQQDIKAFLEVARPKIETFLDNASRISTTTRASVERMETTVNDAIDRVRLQVIRGDEMLTRTMDRIEETSEKVQHTVMSPVRQVSGIVQALSTGFGSYFQQKRRRNGGPSDEMFI